MAQPASKDKTMENIIVETREPDSQLRARLLVIDDIPFNMKYGIAMTITNKPALIIIPLFVFSIRLLNMIFTKPLSSLHTPM